MSVMMKYSNGVDSTILQSLYLTPTLSSGMYLSSGVALMAKSMHDFCKFIVLKRVVFGREIVQFVCTVPDFYRFRPLPIRFLPALEM